MKKAFILSMSKECPDNSHLTECFRSFFDKNGFAACETRDEADIVVVNGCNANMVNPDIAREYAEFAKAHPAKTVFYSGCSPRIEDLSIPNFHLMPYKRMLEQPGFISKTVSADNPFEFLFADKLEVMDAPWTAIGVDIQDMSYIKVSTGCTETCTFCEIRFAKGYVKTPPLETLVAQFEEGLRRGRRKFWLMSDDIGAWGQDRGTNVAELLRTLRGIDPKAELYLHNFHPKFLVDYYDELEPILDSTKLLLLPLQAGSNRVLKLMRRRYEIAPVLEKVRRLRARYPKMIVASTMLVGFPSETHEEFLDTLRASTNVDAAWFIPTHVFENSQAAKIAGMLSGDMMKKRMEMAKAFGARLPGYDVPHIAAWDKVVTWVRQK